MARTQGVALCAAEGGAQAFYEVWQTQASPLGLGKCKGHIGVLNATPARAPPSHSFPGCGERMLVEPEQVGPGTMLPLGWENLGRFLGTRPREPMVGQPVCAYPGSLSLSLSLGHPPCEATQKGLHKPSLLGNKPPEVVLCP